MVLLVVANAIGRVVIRGREGNAGGVTAGEQLLGEEVVDVVVELAEGGEVGGQGHDDGLSAKGGGHRGGGARGGAVGGR